MRKTIAEVFENAANHISVTVHLLDQKIRNYFLTIICFLHHL